MIIDTPRQAHIPGLQQLWQEAFGDSDDFLTGFFATGFSPNRCRCVLAGDEPVAALYWFDCFFGGKKLAYLYAIATDKAYRGRGLCRQLMADTHGHLIQQGYCCSLLVPGSKKLFSLYEKLGYLPFCPMEIQTVTPNGEPVAMTRLTGEEYFSRRQRFLPEGGILQASAKDYLATFTEFYGGEDFLACLSREGNTLFFQEFLGQTFRLPGIPVTLGAAAARLRLPGGSPWAMFRSFDGTDLTGAYFGISLG